MFIKKQIENKMSKQAHEFETIASPVISGEHLAV